MRLLLVAQPISEFLVIFFVPNWNPAVTLSFLEFYQQIEFEIYCSKVVVKDILYSPICIDNYLGIETGPKVKRKEII